ncbi:PHD finger protein ALFIN-LIKE 5 [Morella rubra]|uniref:PHD finger protein ALFIN-LIKE n=1 Tax=Morella rubra TaxID=262757 RepID=A0A6A1VA90_9ROSI|nr:PHD finger protein ALFIN-LIKE 5 [Morella rubra]
MPAKDEDDIVDEEEDEEHGETLCGACGENYAADEFWICCDICEKWFHGKKGESLPLWISNEQWEVNLPTEEVPPELPEPALGINFARDGMQEKDWLSLIAVHRDAWLLAVAFYFGARFGFGKAGRETNQSRWVIREDLKKLWSLKIQQRLRYLLWKIMAYALPVRDSIWYTRNMVTHQNGRVELAVGAIIRRRYDEHEQEWNGRNSLQWEPPPCSNIKISFDGAVDKDVIVFAPGTHPLKAEALSAQLAIHLMEEENLVQACLFEGDAQLMINQIQDDAIQPDWLIEEDVLFIKSKLNDHSQWVFKWIPRNANEMAHRIAKWSRTGRFSGFPRPPTPAHFLRSSLTLSPPAPPSQFAHAPARPPAIKRGSESGKFTKGMPAKDEDDIVDEEEEEEHGETLCGACGENYAADEFWICCDICEKWFHGKCVKITPARAEHIKQYKCPSCSNKRARP